MEISMSLLLLVSQLPVPVQSRNTPSPWCGPPLHNQVVVVVFSALFLLLLQNLEIVIELGKGQSAAESRSGGRPKIGKESQGKHGRELYEQ